MNTLLASLLLALGTCASVQAAGLAGNVEAGQDKIAVCTACHGPDGNSPLASFPRLAGQGERYLLKQLREIKSGQRVVPEMTGLLNPLNDQDLANMAAWYARQKPPVGAADPALVARGQALFRGGKPEQDVPACTGCHLPDGSGIVSAGFPRLGGQHADYIKRQLMAFREGQRVNDGDTQVMRTIASRLSTQDIEALAQYIQGLH
ncbi:cytochrome C [Pseudomonas sp. Leaf127]|uniref:c-type cytochrome n=1 Tax=Pseudomonas sp. Leaf127 TaxID=1736267 RepID=UPI0007037480|nr:c-type cytochrome [Pseudomonas sp. Leaf127]KQQ53703.1 cytochrome C [Pseudomonas sp. Leaf127]